VMVDQEGGLVKRLPGPPDLSAAEMGAAGAGTCHEQGAATGRTLRETGFNVDLAPVLDIGRSGSAIESEGRSFGGGPKRVERCGEAFAAALEATGVIPTAKHFPGLGAAAVNTDEAVQRIDLSASTLRRVDERPYRTYARAGGEDRLVMLSSAIYSAFGERPAAWIRALATDELRARLGFRGVSITDALQTATTDALGGSTIFARRAARAGTDVLLFTSPDAAAEAARSLRDQLRRPRSRERFAASAARVLGLRSRLATD
jgi:beta-N-acetylhexosaminidase